VELKSNDIFIQYTDGLIEAMNQNQELYGNERLEKFLLNNLYKEPNDLLNSLIVDVEKFTAKKIITNTSFSELNDDIALIILKKI